MINKQFTKFEEIYSNSHYKNHIIKKFKELKIGLKSFNIFVKNKLTKPTN